LIVGRETRNEDDSPRKIKNTRIFFFEPTRAGVHINKKQNNRIADEGKRKTIKIIENSACRKKKQVRILTVIPSRISSARKYFFLAIISNDYR
jgi:hypothetical protein